MEPIHLIPFLSVLFVSFLGSSHCGSMCGGFAILSTQTQKFTLGISLYHLGRLLTYLTLGSLLGSIGGLLNDRLVYKTSEIICGVILCWLAWRTLFPKLHIKPLKAGFKLVDRSKKYPLIFPLVLGVVTGFLPCGWLYGFLAVAIGSGSTFHASLIMFLFWLGTIPLLTLVGVAPQALGAKLKLFNQPTFKAALLLVAALSSLAGHSLVLASEDEVTRGDEKRIQLICHGKTFAK